MLGFVIVIVGGRFMGDSLVSYVYFERVLGLGTG